MVSLLELERVWMMIGFPDEMLKRLNRTCVEISEREPDLESLNDSLLTIAECLRDMRAEQVHAKGLTYAQAVQTGLISANPPTARS